MNDERVVDIWGARAPYGPGVSWPARVDEFLSDGLIAADVDRWVRDACLLCSNGCGLEVAVADGRMVGVRGRAEDRINHGRLGPKGLYGWQGQQHERLTAPLVRQGDRLVDLSRTRVAASTPRPSPGRINPTGRESSTMTGPSQDAPWVVHD